MRLDQKMKPLIQWQILLLKLFGTHTLKDKVFYLIHFVFLLNVFVRENLCFIMVKYCYLFYFIQYYAYF